MKEYPLLVEVDSILLSVWKLFEYSPQKFSMFNDIQQTYGLKPLTLIRAATTRWLSHLTACTRFSDRFVQVLDVLDDIYNEKKDPEIYGIRAGLLQKPLVVMILLLCDVLRPLHILSQYLLRSDVNFTYLPFHVKQTTEQLHSLIDSLKNNDESTKFSKAGTFFNEILDRTNLAMRRRGFVDITPQHFLERTGIPFIYKLIAEVEDAFVCSPVLKAFGSLDIRNLPDSIQEAITTDYGLVINLLYFILNYCHKWINS